MIRSKPVPPSTNQRRAVAAVWALLVLALVSTLSAVAVGRFAAARRETETYHNRLQAEWLARSGAELATASLLADERYAGETAELIPGGRVKVKVMKEPGDNDVYRIESEARYPAAGPNTVNKTVQRTVRRVQSGVRIQSVED